MTSGKTTGRIQIVLDFEVFTTGKSITTGQLTLSACVTAKQSVLTHLLTHISTQTSRLAGAALADTRKRLVRCKFLVIPPQKIIVLV